MRRTAVKTVHEYEFQSNFRAPQIPPPEAMDTVSVTASELAELLANARGQGMAAAEVRHDKATAQSLTVMSDQLKAALGELLKLAQCLDRAVLPDEARSEASQIISAACGHIINGQGDLFAQQ